MGSSTHGILWGVVVPDDLDLNGDDEGRRDPRWQRGILPTWESACRGLIRRFDAKYPSDSPEDRFVPVTVFEGSGPELMGFWVALGHNRENGIPGMGTFPLALFPGQDPYNRAYKRAVRRWNRFTRWAKRKGLKLPPAQLWLAETNVA